LARGQREERREGWRFRPLKRAHSEIHRGVSLEPFAHKLGAVEIFSKITIPPNFTAEYTENAEALENPSVDCNALKLCALDDLRGDKSRGF
jgi:hypothetical protein